MQKHAGRSSIDRKTAPHMSDPQYLLKCDSLSREGVVKTARTSLRRNKELHQVRDFSPSMLLYGALPLFRINFPRCHALLRSVTSSLASPIGPRSRRLHCPSLMAISNCTAIILPLIAYCVIGSQGVARFAFPAERSCPEFRTGCGDSFPFLSHWPNCHSCCLNLHHPFLVNRTTKSTRTLTINKPGRLQSVVERFKLETSFDADHVRYAALSSTFLKHTWWTCSSVREACWSLVWKRASPNAWFDQNLYVNTY